MALADAKDKVLLGEYMQILEDPEGDWTLDQVRDQFASRFRNSESSALNFGFTRSTFWLRIAVDATGVDGSWFLVERDTTNNTDHKSFWYKNLKQKK